MPEPDRFNGAYYRRTMAYRRVQLKMSLLVLSVFLFIFGFTGWHMAGDPGVDIKIVAMGMLCLAVVLILQFGRPNIERMVRPLLDGIRHNKTTGGRG